MKKLLFFLAFIQASIVVFPQSFVTGDTVICPEGSMFYLKCISKDSYDDRIPAKSKLIIVSSDICDRNAMKWEMIEVQTLSGQVGYINSKNCMSLSGYQKKIEQNSIDYQNMVAKYGQKNADAILNHQYWIGMTSEIARASLGSPDKNNKSVGSWGVHEQWVYENKGLYLYFENGILTSYQQN